MNLDPELGLIPQTQWDVFRQLIQKLSSFRPVRLVVGSRPIPGIGAQGLKGAPRLSVWTHVVGQQKS